MHRDTELIRSGNNLDSEFYKKYTKSMTVDKNGNTRIVTKEEKYLEFEKLFWHKSKLIPESITTNTRVGYDG